MKTCDCRCSERDNKEESDELYATGRNPKMTSPQAEIDSEKSTRLKKIGARFWEHLDHEVAFKLGYFGIEGVFRTFFGIEGVLVLLAFKTNSNF